MTNLSSNGPLSNFEAFPDHDLVGLAQRGDRDAFAQLVTRYFHMVYLVGFGYLKDRDAADDLAQEVFLKAFVHIADLRNGRYLPAWLNQIARNHALNWLKQGTKRSRVISMVPLDDHKNAADGSLPSARDKAMASEEARLLEEAILDLPDDLRTTILLHYSGDLSKSEIARRLGVHPSSIGRKIDKALLMLREKLGEKVEPSAIVIQHRNESVAKTIAVIAAFAALSKGSQAALLQADGGSALMPPPSPGVLAKLGAMTGPVGLPVSIVGIALLAGAITVISVGWLNDFRGNSKQATDITTPQIAQSKEMPTTTSQTRKSEKALPRKNDRRQVLSVSTKENNVIYGKISTPEGKPAGGARVEVWQPWGSKLLLATTQTDTNGRYEVSVDSISRHPVTVKARYNGYLDTGNTINGNENQAGTLPFKREANIELLRGKTFSGTVINEAGLAIANALISAKSGTGEYFAAGTYETRSGSDGHFSLSLPTSGTSTLVAEAENYAPSLETVSSSQTAVEIKLKAPGATVSGIAVDDVTSAPIAGAGITLTSMYDDILTHTKYRDRVTTTDQAGRFAFQHLPAATYMLRFEKDKQYFIAPEKSPSQTSFFSPPSAPLPHMPYFEVRENTTTALVLPIYPGHTISGRVTEKGTSTPIEGAIVSAGPVDDGYSAVTGADGRYTLNHVPASSRYLDRDLIMGVFLIVTKPGYTWPSGEGDEPGKLMMLRKEKRMITADLEIVPTVTISGIVRSPEGNPLAGAQVTRLTKHGLDQNSIALTDENGRYHIEQESYKSVRLRATAPGYTLGYQTRRISGDPISDLDIVLTRPGRVAGIVIDQIGIPVAGAEVKAGLTLWDKEFSWGYPIGFQSVKTNSEGKFAFENLPPYEVRLGIEKQGFAKVESTRIMLKSGEHKSDVKIILRSGLSVKGQVADLNGVPLSNVRVEAMIAQSHQRMGQKITDGKGRFEITELLRVPDQLSLWNLKSGRMDLVDISGMDKANLKVVLDETGVTLRGQVIDYLTSAPVTAGVVKLRDKGYDIGTEKPGEFVVPELMRGSVNTFVVEVPGYRPVEFEKTAKSTDKEMTQTVVVGPGGFLAGRVLGEKGEPVSNIEVQLCDGSGSQMILNPKTEAVTQTDKNGNYQFAGVKAEQMSVIVNPKAPLVPMYETMDVKHGDRIQVPDFQLNRGSQVVITMIEEATGKPMAGVLVKLMGASLSKQTEVKTNSSGKVTFQGVYGRGPIVSSSEYHMSDILKLGNEPLVERSYELGKAVLNGKILKDGKPLVGTVQISQPGSKYQVQKVQTDSDGVFEISNLTSGKWDLSFSYGELSKERDWTTSLELPALGQVNREFDLSL